MKAAKALLDSLMGPSRDIALKCRTGEDFMADNVCKHYLVGFCPSSVLGKKSEIIEPCENLHSIALKEEFERHPKVEKHRRDYEKLFLRKLESIADEADSKASREKRKKRPKESIVKVPDHLKVKMEAYEEARKLKLKEAEEKGNAGDIEGSKEAMGSAAICQRDIEGILKAHTQEFPGEEVCESCGVRYLVGKPGDAKGFERPREGEVWEEEHFSSKAHKGYEEIRAKIKELKEKFAKEAADRRGRSKSRENGRRSRSRRSQRDRRSGRRSRSQRDRRSGRRSRSRTRRR